MYKIFVIQNFGERFIVCSFILFCKKLFSRLEFVDHKAVILHFIIAPRFFLIKMYLNLKNNSKMNFSEIIIIFCWYSVFNFSN